MPDHAQSATETVMQWCQYQNVLVQWHDLYQFMFYT